MFQHRNTRIAIVSTDYLRLDIDELPTWHAVISNPSDGQIVYLTEVGLNGVTEKALYPLQAIDIVLTSDERGLYATVDSGYQEIYITTFGYTQ